MFVHRVESTYGRIVPKPQVGGEDEDELFDEVVPIQDQIENLRTKISLKEKYNRVLTENFEESRQGASTILFDLFMETKELRYRLMAALRSERTCVQTALRSYRIFQLAMTDRNAKIAIPWLDDKLFDTMKKLNNLLYELNEKRKKLEDAERMVIMIEKWPRPGTLTWELAALTEFERLDNVIENIKIKRETTMILHAKYYNIKFLLREEQGKYFPTLRFYENQLRQHRQEIASLQKMLDDAILFRDDALKDLTITEKEASENRKQRRKQMAKMKKAVEKVLVDNQTHGNPPAKNQTLYVFNKFEEKEETSHILDELKYKKGIAEEYRDRARRLVEVMRVSDLTLIPIRSKTVNDLGERLQIEMEAKEEFRDLLLKQKNQLILILCQLRYTGQAKLNRFKERKADYNRALIVIRSDDKEAHRRLNRYGNTFVNLRLNVLSTLARLNENKRRSKVFGGDLKTHMKHMYNKIKKLVKSVDELAEKFEDREPERNYDQFVRPPPVQPRLIRIGSPVVTDESDEEDMPDLKVPNRQEIKTRSLRYIHQAILKRGLR